MEGNEKYTARIPIIPDELVNRSRHKDKEIVLDDLEDDIYIKRGDKYVNITGAIRETVQEIRDGSCVIHVVTEESLPAIKDRPKNHWYYIITKSEEYKGGEPVNINAYIYYGVINDEYYLDKSYLLIGQNMIINPSAIRMKILEGYKACFYVPTTHEPEFYNDETGEKLNFTLQDRLYCMTSSKETIPYDVYISDESNLGDIFVRVQFTGSDWYIVKILSNDDQITGLEIPVKEVRVEDGSVIGKIPDPIWTDPRYVLKGWSLKKAEFQQINPEEYKPIDSMNLFAFFDYDNDPTKYTYKCVFVSSTGKNIGTFYSVAQPNSLITAKEFDGYQTPIDKVELTKDGQIIQFTYDPIVYNVNYIMDGGTITGQKVSYTIEEEYTPPIPYREGYSFQRWTPRRITINTIGDITFTAIWDANSVLKPGPSLRTAISTLYVDIEKYVTSITRSSLAPKDDDRAINIAIEGAPVYMWYTATDSMLRYYAEYEIACNADMTGMFEGFVKLRDISSLIEWGVTADTIIVKMFKGCTALSDLSPISGWDLTGGNFAEAFSGTAAELSGRLPNWYTWLCTIQYISNHIIGGVPTNKIIRTETLSKIPGSSFIPTPTVPIQYYNIVSGDPFIIVSKDQIFKVNCDPVLWDITYDMVGGTWGPSVQQDKILNKYGVEDIAESPYIPPQDVVKAGSVFAGWKPSSMPIRTTGAFKFTVVWS